MSRVHTLYFIHHSHTDIGYTHDQPIVFDLHQRFLDEALNLTDAYADRDTDGAFRWTVETTHVFSRWLQNASPQQIERFKVLEHAGRIEVTGMFANITPLYDTDQLVESFQLLRPLREDFGFTIRHAMNCDVNGENWSLVDVLLDLGIEGFTMAINTHFGGAPFERPNVFWWQGPSGRKLLAYNGWAYDQGWRFGIGRDAVDFAQTWWSRVERRLDEINYPLPVLMVQSYHPFGDNGSAFGAFPDFIDTWNAQGRSPRIIMATPKDWWAAVKEHGALVPTYRGDWTDYWNFGCISSAREQTINRASRARLCTADALAGFVAGMSNAGEGSRTARSFALYREQAWNALHLFDEHTWGADISVRVPGSEDTASQWQHKADFAYTARSLSLLLRRDALAELAQQVTREDPHNLLVFNPLPWTRVIAGEISPNVVKPRGVPADVTAGRHFQDRDFKTWSYNAAVALSGQTENPKSDKHFWLKPVEVPGFGYRVVSVAELVEWGVSSGSTDDTSASATHDLAGAGKNVWRDDASATHDLAGAGKNVWRDRASIENERFRLAFDTERGGIRSWYDRQLSREWVDPSAGYSLNTFVHEQVADMSHPWSRNLLFQMEWESEFVERPRGWKTGWQAARTTPSRVLAHRVYETPLGIYVIQLLEAPGCVGPLKQSVFMPNNGDYIECESWWNMGLETHPEATYLLYPLDVPKATARLDLGGQSIIAGADQLPGVCRDYFTAQQWVDFSNDEFGVTVALPENPIVQLGSFHFGDNQSEFALERAMLLGWVTNNYWETNFRAHQPGRVHARYRLEPHRGAFDEGRAHRFGSEAAHAQPLVQHLGEPQRDAVMLPATGSLLQLPGSDSPILTLHVKPAPQHAGILVRLLNASDHKQRARIGSGLLRILRAEKCDLLGKRVEAIDVAEGGVSVTFPPREVVTVRLDVELVG